MFIWSRLTRVKTDRIHITQTEMTPTTPGKTILDGYGNAPGGGLSATRIWMSVIADMKDFNGKDRDDDWTRSWISKVKYAFPRDQAPDEAKCPVFGDHLTDPARNCYNRLSRSTCRSWKDLLEIFLVQYGGNLCRLEDNITMKRSDCGKLHWNT